MQEIIIKNKKTLIKNRKAKITYLYLFFTLLQSFVVKSFFFFVVIFELIKMQELIDYLFQLHNLFQKLQTYFTIIDLFLTFIFIVSFLLFGVIYCLIGVLTFSYIFVHCSQRPRQKFCIYVNTGLTYFRSLQNLSKMTFEFLLFSVQLLNKAR